VQFPARQTLDPELERLWALARIDDLGQRREGEDPELQDAMVDLAIAHSLVTDVTSMIVVRKERAEDLGIGRANRDRVANERLARTGRAASVPRATRVDESQTMFSQPMQRTRGGGGAAGPELLGLVGALVGLRAWLHHRARRS
jgi:Ca-activated chloride channel family protein